MSTIVTRAGKDAPLTNTELDSNFTNLDTYIDQRTNPLQLASRVAMTAAASGSNGIQVLDNPQVNFGTGDFTLHWEGALPDYTPSDSVRLFIKSQDTSNRYDMRVNTNGTLLLIVVASGVTTFQVTSTVTTGLTDGSYAKISATVIRETASTDGAVTFYVNGVQLGAAVSITAAATTDISNTGILAINGFSAGSRFASDLNQALTFNRALSAAEVLSLCVNGPELADVGASQTPAKTFDFSAGTDGFTSFTSTVTGNIDGIGGVDNTLRVVATGTGSVRCALAASVVSVRNESKIRVYIPSTNVTAVGVKIVLSSPTVISELFVPAFDTWTDITQVLTGTGAQTSWSLWMATAAGSTSSGITVGDTFYIESGGTLKQIGITAQYNAQDAQSDTGQLFDSSGNKNHALLPAAGATVLPRRLSGEVRWTNTWAGTNELQYIGGVNQAILPANAYIESIIGTVSGATPHDIIIGDGSDTDRYVTLTTDLAAGVISFALTSRVTDGTNLKLTVDPDTNSVMSIAFTIKYSYLES